IEGQPAGADRFGPLEHGAGAADADAAAVLGAGQLERIAQHPEQRRVALGRDRALRAVDGDPVTAHVVPPTSPASSVSGSGRWRRRRPVAAKIALATAGATPGTGISPAPEGGNPESTVCTSTAGMRDIGSTG